MKDQLVQLLKEQLTEGNSFETVVRYLDYNFDVEDEDGNILLEGVHLKVAISSDDNNNDEIEQVKEVKIGNEILYVCNNTSIIASATETNLLVLSTISKKFDDFKLRTYLNYLMQQR